MENNQQHQSTNESGKQTGTSFSNDQPGQQLPKESEATNANRFAEISGVSVQHSESSRPDAANETLGTP